MSCDNCLRAKQINVCSESLILGTGAIATDYDVYIKNSSTNNVDLFQVTSDGAGLITIDTTDYTFPEGNSFEIWVVLRDASITERETLTFPQGDGTIIGNCVTFDSIAVKKDGCNVIAAENLIVVIDEESEQEAPCLCITQAILDATGGGKILSGTYAEIVAALTAGIDLNIYTAVLITDYQTIYDQPDFDNTGTAKGVVTTKTSSVTEPLLIGLLDTNTLKADAYSSLYPKDRIRYDITFNQTEVMGAAAKGRITERIDHLNNRTDYDHRHVVFKRYESAPASGIFNQYKDNGGASQEFYTFDFAAEIADGTPGGFSYDNYLGDIALEFYIDQATSFILGNNIFKKYATANKFGSLTINNTFGENFVSNEIVSSISNNIFGDSCFNNKFFTLVNCSFGNSCSFNNFYGTLSNVNTGNSFSDNRGGVLNSCTLGNSCGSNDFGISCTNLTFGNAATNNTFQNVITNINFTLATHVYQSYHCNLFLNATPAARLSYIDAGDNLIIVVANA